MPDLLLNFLLALAGCLTLFLLLMMLGHVFVAVPFVPTPMPVVRKMIEASGLQDGQVLYDLGAGDARLLVEAKRRFPNCTVVGCELQPTVWLLGKLRVFFSRKQVTFNLGNALRQDVREADGICLFLMPELLEALEEKFNEELKPGATVVSYVFPFPRRQPVREIPVRYWFWERKIRVYRW